MVHTATVRQRIGAGFLAVMLLVLSTAAIVAACPTGCCEADGAMTIGRAMACCEIPTVSEREPASAEPARTANLVGAAPHVVLHELAQSDVLVVHTAHESNAADTGGHRRLHAPLFLINAQFLI